MKLVSDAQARSYELTCLVNVSFTEAELTAVKEDLHQIVTYHKGTVLDTQDWGKRDMEYSITKGGKRHTQARYLHLIFSAMPKATALIDHDLHLNEKVFRHLLVVAEEAPVATVAKAAVKKAELAAEPEETEAK